MPWIYDTNKDNTARYTLAPQSQNILFCFGVNPSTASPEKLDNTVSSVQRIALRHDFESFMMLNLYPQRATDPNNMHDTLDEYEHMQNLLHIEKYIAANADKKILAAWGTLIEKRPYLKRCLQDIFAITKKYNCTWYCIGNISKKGHPHHPLYLSNAEMLKEFDIETYIASL